MAVGSWGQTANGKRLSMVHGDKQQTANCRRQLLREKARMEEKKWPFEDLRVWQESMNWVEEIYLKSQNFPAQEQYGLNRQLRRAALSVPLNISEGRGRHHKKEYIQFLYTARGSLYEVITCLKLAVRLKFIKKEKIDELQGQSNQIHRQLNALIKSLR